MKQIFLIIFCLCFLGCGGSDTQVNTPTGTVNVPVNGLRGNLSTLLCLTDYQDNACPYTEEQITLLGSMLSEWVTRQSTGAAWTTSRLQRITLPGTSVDYAEEIDHNDNSFRHRIQQDCISVANAPEPYQVFFLPNVPRSYVGGGRADHLQGFAWIASLEADPIRLPLPHEFGHVLGLLHGGGVMNQLTPDWTQNFDEQALNSLGWLSTERN